MFKKSSFGALSRFLCDLSTEALDCVLLGTHSHSCSLAVTLMYLNVVWEVEGGLRYWSDIEWWMMQCPYVILKTFKAPRNLFFPPPPASSLPPCLWNVKVGFFLSPSHNLWPFSHVFVSFCVTCRHTFAYHHGCGQTRLCHIFIAPDFDKVMSNSHLSGAGGQVGCRRKLNLLWQVLSGLWRLGGEQRGSKTSCTSTVFNLVSFPHDPWTPVWATAG